MQVKMGRTLEAGHGPRAQERFCPPVFPLILAKAKRAAKQRKLFAVRGTWHEFHKYITFHFEGY